MLNKKVILPLLAVGVIGASVYGVSRASAASDTTSPRDSLIQKLADTFHLDKSKVQAVFDQQRTENQQARETRYENRLDQAVTNGQLTASQKAAVLTEHNKLADELKAAMAKTGADRRTALNAIRQEGEDWAKANNIDAKWLMAPGHPHLRGGHRHMAPSQS